MKKKQILKIVIALMLFIPVGYSIHVVTASEPFVLKWTATTGVSVTSGITPLAVDINHDGIMEIFVSGDREPNADKIYCFNGNSGKLIWVSTLPYSISTHCPMEIYDLNNDGKYEIIQPGPNALQVLHAEDGSLYWYNSAIKCSEAYQLVLDTDKTGYPYIYTCNADDTSPYTGMLRKVDGRTGNILISKSIYYPCHGGLSAADVDNDGDFELFLSDRNNGNGKGIQCYDAKTLNLLWNRGDIYCSSHLPVIVDVNNDGVLDVVVSQQRDSNAGIYCLDGRTGNNIAGKCQDSISGLASHETFAVYDVDNDGHLELATCAGGNVKIFDLGSWKIEATLTDDAKPPYYANVMGDGNLEIILSDGVSSISIYNNQYQLIDTIPNVHSQGSIVNDIDGDGLNELVEISEDGTVRAYDTSAVASNPLPRTNTNNYSERNARAAVYIPAPGGASGNQAPTISSPNPTNGLTNVPITLTALSIVIRDLNGDSFAYTIQTNPNIGSKSVQGSNDGTKTCAITGLTYSTTYHWYVNATDGKSWTRQSYTFKTASASGNNPPVFSGMTPTNNSVNIPISISSISLTIKDPEGQSFDCTLQTRPNAGSKSMNGASNGSKSCTLSTLAYGTTYRWWVNATDGNSWTRRWYTFTTESAPGNKPLVLSRESPADGSTNIPINRTSVSINIKDPEGKSFNYVIQTYPNIGGKSANGASNGTKACVISGLKYRTTYHWYVSCKDTVSGQWVNQSYWFTTQNDPSDTGSSGNQDGGTYPPDDNESLPLPPNNPPETPLQPIGSIFIGRGINYTYMSSAIDLDEDQIRFRFDWGDGNFSNWTDFVDSNTNVSASHAWNGLSNYSIRIIAQDSNGSNSSWSSPLNITVLEPEVENRTPSIDIKTINSGLVNQTIIFDASVNNAPDIDITEYVWDFGDGTKKTGKTSDHVYKEPGVYQVNLTVVDHTEQTFTKTIQVIIDAYTEITAQPKSPSSFPYVGVTLLFFTCCIVLGITFFYRRRIYDTQKASVHHIRSVEEQVDELLFQRYGK
jgi:hypothetical protein